MNLSFGCTYETHPKTSDKMHTFYTWYNPTWKVEWEFKWDWILEDKL